MAKARPALAVSAIDRDEIGHWLSAHGTPQQVSLRGQIILAAADGQSDSAIARALAINRKTVTLWRARYAAGGLESLWEVAPGRGRKPRYGPEKIEQIVEATLQTTPPGMTHWSCRVMAQRHGVSKSTISNIWRSHNLKPHLSETFKLSRDPRFFERLAIYFTQVTPRCCGPRRGLPRLFRGQATDQPNDRRDAGTAARAPFRRSLDATRSPGLRRPLHADGPACLPQARTPRCCGPVGGLPRLFRGQAADQPQRPKRRRHCCSGALQAVFGCNAVAWSPKTTARRWAPRVCRKPGPQQVGAT